MLSRLWALVHYGIAAKLYLLTAISIAALLVLATASLHFATQTKLAGERLFREGITGIQAVTQLEVLFEQHRALITSAPAELDRGRLRNRQQAMEAVNTLIDGRVLTELSQGDAPNEILQTIAAQVPKLKEAGYRVLMFAQNFAQDKALELSQGDYSQSADVIQAALQGWYQQQIRAVDREVNRLSKASNDLIVWVVASALVAFVLIGPVTLWAKHRILSRLDKITAVMHRLCNNELGVAVPYIKALDEMGDIARTIDVFKANAIALGLTHIQLDAALNNMVQGLCMFDGQNRLVLCNDRFREIFRLSGETINSGMSLLAVMQCIASANGFPKGAADRADESYRARIRKRIGLLSAGFCRRPNYRRLEARIAGWWMGRYA